LWVTVVIVTCRWALPYSLTSVDSQTRKPEEEVIALKPPGDSSEEVTRSFSLQLPIKLVVQEKGNFTNAVQIAIDNAKGNVLFLDDDAVAEERWVENTKTYSTPCPTSAESAENHTKHISRAVRLSKLMSPSPTKNRRETHFIESRYRNT
jgi:GT2 family glycosyltransferase